MLLVSLFLLGLNNNVNAQSYWVVDTRTFILDYWNDLGKIIPKWTYYTPRISYKDSKSVANRFLKWLYYPWDFYTKRNITPQLIKWENKYFEVNWRSPYFIKSLSWIKRVLKGYLFAYRKNWNIFWMDAQNFTPAFLSWYWNRNNQSLIIYPIRDRKTKKIKAFVEYPCWNLVCKDTLCTDLKVTPICWDGVFNPEIWEQCDYNDPKTKKGCTQTCTYKKLWCSVKNTKEEIFDTQHPYIQTKKDSNVSITKYYLNRNEYKNVYEINKQKLTPWIYKVTALAKNKYSWQEFLCEGSEFKVIGKEFCWDGIVNGNEECDYKDTSNNWSCSRTCKFTKDSCSIITKKTRLDSSTPFKDVISVKYSDKTKLTWLKVNGNNINPNTFNFNSNWKYNIEAIVTNSYSWKSAICKKYIVYSQKEFCWDGIVNGYETCDDWNSENWDGCSKYCKLEIPYCKITNLHWYIYNEGEKYKDALKLSYRGLFNIAIVNNKDYYHSEQTFLNTTIQANKCSTRNYFEYTVSNRLDPTLTKVCKAFYMVKNKEFCWDGIVNGNEECDIEDPITWPFCNNSCKFKKPNNCQLLSNTIPAWKYASLVVDTDYYSTPYKAIIDKKQSYAKNWVFKIKMQNPWTYTMYVAIQNKLDRRHLNDKICEFNLVVTPNECKQ